MLSADNHPERGVWRRAVGARTSRQRQLPQARLGSHHQLLLNLHVLGLDAVRVQLVCKNTDFMETTDFVTEYHKLLSETELFIYFQQLIPTDRRSYMLHPLYPKVLLQFTNALDHIIAFKGDVYLYM